MFAYLFLLVVYAFILLVGFLIITKKEPKFPCYNVTSAETKHER